MVKWLAILKQCKRPKQVVVIHNSDLFNIDYAALCFDNKVQYIYRKNIGFDIGAFQDVCSNRLQGFPQWEQLLWCTDDTFPMVKDFISYFDLKPGDGVRCMEISPYVRSHIRTTGFSIAKHTAIRLNFPADPVLTKEHCYLFEHRAGRNTFMTQVLLMGLTVKMVAPKEKSPLFDIGYHRRQPRDNELHQLWSITKNKVSVICPVFNTYPEIISSMICQTHKNWELLLVHDGPNITGLAAIIEAIGDNRITYAETETHKGLWGHYIRQAEIKKATGDYILVTNADNHHVPVFLEYMLKGFHNGTVATYCSDMIHNYKAWQQISCSPKRGYIDCAGVLVRADAAKAVGWNNITDHSSDWFYFNDLINKYGLSSFVKINGCLLIHN